MIFFGPPGDGAVLCAFTRWDTFMLLGFMLLAAVVGYAAGRWEKNSGETAL